jgi:FtsH-binding integral membrane protein
MSYLFTLNSNLSDPLRSHLLRVYSLLTAGVASACLGCYADMHYFHYGSVATALIGAFLFGLARSGVTASTKENTVGVGIFLLACGSEGMSLSPIIHTALNYYPQALITAVLSSLAVFASFSVAAIIAKRREFFYLSGVLGTVVSVLSLVSLTNLFVRSDALLDVQIYGGLAMFVAYILLDTQVMIERFENGSYFAKTNFVRPACDLFGDLVGVFIRLLIILMKKAERRGQHSRHSSFNASPERRYYKRTE